jgi:ABC-type molybdate transport system ATPase subunit
LLEILRSLAASGQVEAEPDIYQLQQQVVQKGLENARGDCEQVLGNITLATWLEQAEKSGLLSTPSTAPNFSI